MKQSDKVSNEGDTSKVSFRGVKGRDSGKVRDFFLSHPDEEFTPKDITLFCKIGHSSAKKICMRFYLKGFIESPLKNHYLYKRKITADEFKIIQQAQNLLLHNTMITVGDTNGDKSGVRRKRETNPNNLDSKFQVGGAQVKIFRYERDRIKAPRKRYKIPKKKVQNSTKNSTLSGRTITSKPKKITKTEKEYLRLLSDGITAPHRLAVCRNCEVSIVYRHLRNLKKKRLINDFNEIVQNLRVAQPNPKQQHAEGGTGSSCQVRTHSQKWKIDIIEKKQGYEKHIGKTIYIDDNAVCCWADSIDVHGTKSFIADDLQKALAKSMDYWTGLFTKIEHDLKIILIHERYQNIKLVWGKYGEMDSEIAKDCELRGERIKIYAKEDGKLWFDIDNSWNFHEMHTLHPKTGKEDLEKVKKHIDDWRTNDSPTSSEMASAITVLAKAMTVTINNPHMGYTEQPKKEKPNKDDPMFS
ncbi:MAG: hypothetical protein PHH85_03445 [Candidatus Methanoperedens sp.]|nr:hypothetical protein [Candidatus Methanoperedens sp.]